MTRAGDFEKQAALGPTFTDRIGELRRKVPGANCLMDNVHERKLIAAEEP